MTSLYREPDERQAPTVGALELRDVFRIFGAGDAETVALRGLDLRVEQGELSRSSVRPAPARAQCCGSRPGSTYLLPAMSALSASRSCA